MRFNPPLNKLLIFLILTTLLSCFCDKVLHAGEMLRIPIEFKNFSEKEINTIKVYRIDKDSSLKRDTFFLNNYVYTIDTKSKKVIITDNTGDYDSYFNKCDLVFDWDTGTDTFNNMIVLKSKAKAIDKCHEDNPNVRVDHVSFFHKGKIIRKDKMVIIEK